MSDNVFALKDIENLVKPIVKKRSKRDRSIWILCKRRGRCGQRFGQHHYTI